MGIETIAGVIGTTILLAGGTAATISAVDQAKIAGKKKKQSEADRLKALGAGPIAGEATPKQKARIRRKTRTLLASPLTGEEEFGIPAPTLLGSGDVTKKATVG